MDKPQRDAVDGSFAACNSAYFMSEAAFIFPITPSTPMSEQVHVWSTAKRKNMFRQPLLVRQMQSEGGSAGALHGACSSGALATTFTGSQGLLLMLPNMFKLAGELLPCVIHIAARTVATEALSIFGDHSDVYATRDCGFAFLASSSVQEAAHMAIAAHVATVRSRVPFGHFMDGLRTTHEISSIHLPSDDQIQQCVDWAAIAEFRKLALNPMRPIQRGTAQNPDQFFQATERNNKYYWEVPSIVEQVFEKIHEVFGVRYSPFEYYGHPEATEVVVLMGSAVATMQETAEYLNAQNKKVGVVKVRLYRPFSVRRFVEVLPKTTRVLGVLDRGREPNAVGDPLYVDVCAALMEDGSLRPRVIGGRYGLSSRDFNPDMCLAVFKNLWSSQPKNHFTVGIIDDVTFTSLDFDEHISTISPTVRQCLLWGIGGDGTVGANKTAIKLIGNNTELCAQGFFAYDANKAGGLTISHLRFGPNRFDSPYYITDADYLACHNTTYIHRFPNLTAPLKVGGNFVLNCPWITAEELDMHLPDVMKRNLARRKAKLYVIDATRIAREAGIGPYVNMCLQSVFFYLSGVMDVDQAIKMLKDSIHKMYGHKGTAVVERNVKAVEGSLDPRSLIRIEYPLDKWSELSAVLGPKQGLLRQGLEDRVARFYEEIFAPVARQEGESVPVSRFAPGGDIPTGTSQLGKRGVADSVPRWLKDLCIQCNRCSFVCPHAVIRAYYLNKEEKAKAPSDMETLPCKHAKEHDFRIGVSALDCTGCALCVETCPVKALEMTPLQEQYSRESENIRFVHDEVVAKPELGNTKSVLGIGARPPLMEFPGSCAGCGETPYIRLISQLFGERMCIAAATGCNTIWGGSYPIVPYRTRSDTGEGPAWANSLFEDAAEYGYGIATGHRQRRAQLVAHIDQLLARKGPIKGLTAELRSLLEQWLRDRESFELSREVRDRILPFFRDTQQVAQMDPDLAELATPDAQSLLHRVSFWILGGDGFAYDIGFGGIDHVISTNEDINILILDTEVYSNTGGQKSKATPMAAQAKLAVSGNIYNKKEMGLMALNYGHVYVATIAMGSNFEQTVRAFHEAESYPGPSIILAYSPCTEHHVIPSMRQCMNVQKLAVETGYDPRLREQNKNPFHMDCKKPSKDPSEYLKTQGRFVALELESKEHALALQACLRQELKDRYEFYTRLQNLYEPGKSELTAPALTAPVPTREGRLCILYASETGNSETAARWLNEQAVKVGISTHLSELDAYGFAQDLAKENVVVIVHSSNASGMPPNGQTFRKWLMDPGHPKNMLKKVQFALFGLGDDRFERFQWCPLESFQRMQDLGAAPFFERGIGNENAGGFEKSLSQWGPAMLKVAKDVVAGKAPPLVPVPAEEVSVHPAKPAESGTVESKEVKLSTPPEVTQGAGKLDHSLATKAAEAAANNSQDFVQVAPNVYWVGAVDFDIRDFHGIDVQKGSSYNSYLILGPKPTLIDTVKAPFSQTLLANIQALIDPTLIEYVVVNHAEPDHSSSLGVIMAACSNAAIVCNKKCRDALVDIYRIPSFRSQKYNLTASYNRNTAMADASLWKFLITDDKNPSLELCMIEPFRQTLSFIDVPLVHWPESMWTYLVEERILFSNDAFGQHVASTARFDDQLVDTGGGKRQIPGFLTIQELVELNRSYYANILMPYPRQIAKALELLKEKLPVIDRLNPKFNPQAEKSYLPRILATAHGLSWRALVDDAVEMYHRWSTDPRLPKVLIVYDTMYGSTERMARAMYEGAVSFIQDGKTVDVVMFNVQDTHITTVANELLDCSCLAMGSCSLNNEILPTVHKALTYIKGLKPQGRSGVVFGSYGWSPIAVKYLSKMFEDMGIKSISDPISCKFSPNDSVLTRCYEIGSLLAKTAILKL